MRRPLPVIAVLALCGCLKVPPSGTDIEQPGDEAEDAPSVVPARAVAELYQVGEIRGFEFTQSGQPIGRSFGRYDGTVSRDGRTLHRFSTRIELLPPGGEPLHIAAELLLDEKGELVEGWERSDFAELRFLVLPDKQVLAIEADAGLEVQTAEFAYEPGTAFMGFMYTMHEELMLSCRELKIGENEWRLISLSSGRADPWSAKVERQGKTIVIDTSLGEEIWLEEGRIVRIEVPDDELVITIIAHARWPEWEVTGPKAMKYEKPANATFEIRELELPGDPKDPVLRGEVLVPDPAVHGPGPFPGVVFLGGSVSADRYGFAGPPAVDLGYHETTDALANAGFVVIRYDERGVGESEDGDAPSWIAQRVDSRRAFRTLLVQPEVDPDRILAIGHAEGGWRALSLANERPQEIVGVALLATLGRSYRQLFADQPEILKALESGQGLPERLAPMAQWYGEILVEDPDALIFRAQVPLWIAQGLKDFETDPVKDLSALTAAARKYKKKFEVERFADLDHHFKKEIGTSSATSYLKERPVDREFLAALVEWARKATKAGKPAKSK
jgi:dienelactone hydrolase